MISLQFITNIEQLIQALQDKTSAVIDQIRRGMFEGVRLFEGAAIREFYTGRKGTKGLNVITGTLRRGWLTKTITSYDDFIVQLGNKVIYGPTHEFSDTRKSVNGKMIVYRKRTDVIGKFKREGLTFINKAVTNKLSKYVKIQQL
jgi:hypothetical protein